MVEIQADKDQLRAEFAMSTRRLEMSVEQLKSRTTGQLAELGKKTEAINSLKTELGEEIRRRHARMKSREKALREQIRAIGRRTRAQDHSMHETSRTLSDKEAALTKISAELGERSILSDSQRVEIVALRTQAEALKSRRSTAPKPISARRRTGSCANVRPPILPPRNSPRCAKRPRACRAASANSSAN